MECGPAIGFFSRCGKKYSQEYGSIFRAKNPPAFPKPEGFLNGSDIYPILCPSPGLDR
jgi:hypothetical protein